MSRWALLMALPLLLAAAPAGGGVPLWPRETEAQLQERLEKEHNPVKKAKETARLARMKLGQAMDAYDARHVEEGLRLVGAYLGGIKDAWQTLRNSGGTPRATPGDLRNWTSSCATMKGCSTIWSGAFPIMTVVPSKKRRRKSSR